MDSPSYQMDSEKRVRANFRERRRVSEMNSWFELLLNLLPPSNFKTRLSRAQILREAAEYIRRLAEFLAHPDENEDPKVLFPQIFKADRRSNKDSYRRPVQNPKPEGGNEVHAYISRHELRKSATIKTTFKTPEGVKSCVITYV